MDRQGQSIHGRNAAVRYQFEDYVFDTSRRELRRGETLIVTEPQVFDLLAFLLANRERLVSKEDLLASVWGGRIVSESTLDSRVHAARRIIGDNGKEQRLIRTTIGKGIRFVGSVREHPTPIEVAALQPPPPLSIAVLPFTNLSNDPEQEYFADAITDDLTINLSRIANSFVISRSTASTYKGKPVASKQIGHDLGVRYVVEGSVRRLGEQVLVNVQLIDAATGTHVWADRFGTDRSDLAKAQNAISGRLAGTLHIELVTAAGHQIEQEKSTNLDAHDLAMRGWATFHQPITPGAAQAALRFFEDALKLDPASVEAKTGAAQILIENTIKGWSKSREEDRARAERLLTDALERNNNHPRTHFAMGMLRRLQNRHVESKIELEKTLSLDPNFAGALLQLGYTLNGMGEPDAALPHFEKALAVAPKLQNVVYLYSGLGFCHLALRHTDQAIDFFRKARAANPRLWYIHMGLAAALGLNGDLVEAKEALGELIKLRPDVTSLSKTWAAEYDGPPPAAYNELPLYIGLRRAGMPEE